MEALLTGREIELSPHIKPIDNYASYAYHGCVTSDYKCPPPFQEIPLQGYPFQSTIHYHCGIGNGVASISEGSSCLYKTLNQETLPSSLT